MKIHYLLLIFLLPAVSFSQQPRAANNECTIYLIGDAGTSPVFRKITNRVLDNLTDSLAANHGQKNTSVLFLGDNVYQSGLFDTSKNRLTKKIDRQLKVLDNYRGAAFFIPGNHDWDHGGKKLNKVVSCDPTYAAKTSGEQIIRNEEVYIERYAEKNLPELRNFADTNINNIFYPHNSAPGPEFILLDQGTHLGLVIFDSQYFLNDGANGFNPDSSTFSAFKMNFNRMISDAEKRGITNIILSAHHPVYSVGRHGRADGEGGQLTPQDIEHESNKKLMAFINDEIIRSHPSMHFIYTSGHEHMLEYFQTEDNHQYIVSGSSGQLGGKLFKKDPNLKYQSSKVGYFKITYYRDNKNEVRCTISAVSLVKRKEFKQVQLFP